MAPEAVCHSKLFHIVATPAGFIWSVADLLRGPYHPNQYKDVMLPWPGRRLQ